MNRQAPGGIGRPQHRYQALLEEYVAARQKARKASVAVKLPGRRHSPGDVRSLRPLLRAFLSVQRGTR